MINFLVAVCIAFLKCRSPLVAGMGGKVADCLSAAGIHLASDLQRYDAQRLAAACGLKLGQAASLVEWGHGRDDAAVVDKGAPKSLQVKMVTDRLAYWTMLYAC